MNTQITFEGIEHPGFVVASSYVAQVFGCEHELSLREGDLVTKNSWMAKLQDVQVGSSATICMYKLWLSFTVRQHMSISICTRAHIHKHTHAHTCATHTHIRTRVRAHM